MALILDGTNGLSDVDGSASTPAIRGTDTNTGIFFPAADTIAFSEGGAEVARFDSSGNLGIGTSSPLGKLNVSSASFGGTVSSNGNQIVVENSGNAGITIATGASSLGNIFFADSGDTADGFVQYDQSGRSMRFGTATAERMRIDSSGNLLVGSTSANGKLYVENSSVTNTAKFSDTNASTTSDGICIALAARNTTNNTFYALGYYNTGVGAYKFRVADSGNVTNTNNSYGAISDVKLKENIVDASPKLEDLCKVKIRQYNLKSDPDHKQIGVVAQELEEVFAGLVETTIDKDLEGNDLGTTTKQVKYSVFVPMLIKAIQEQQAIITDLKSRIEALEAK